PLLLSSARHGDAERRAEALVAPSALVEGRDGCLALCRKCHLHAVRLIEDFAGKRVHHGRPCRRDPGITAAGVVELDGKAHFGAQDVFVLVGTDRAVERGLLHEIEAVRERRIALAGLRGIETVVDAIAHHVRHAAMGGQFAIDDASDDAGRNEGHSHLAPPLPEFRRNDRVRGIRAGLRKAPRRNTATRPELLVRGVMLVPGDRARSCAPLDALVALQRPGVDRREWVRNGDTRRNAGIKRRFQRDLQRSGQPSEDVGRHVNSDVDHARASSQTSVKTAKSPPRTTLVMSNGRPLMTSVSVSLTALSYGNSAVYGLTASTTLPPTTSRPAPDVSRKQRPDSTTVSVSVQPP